MTLFFFFYVWVMSYMSCKSIGLNFTICLTKNKNAFTLRVWAWLLTWSEASESQLNPEAFSEGDGEIASQGAWCISPSWRSKTADLREWCGKTLCPNGTLDLHYLWTFLSLQHFWKQKLDQLIVVLCLRFFGFLPSGGHWMFKQQLEFGCKVAKLNHSCLCV